MGYCSDSIQSFPTSEVYVPDFVPTINLEDRIILDIRKPTEWEKGIAAGNVIKYEIGDLFKKVTNYLLRMVKDWIRTKSMLSIVNQGIEQGSPIPT